MELTTNPHQDLVSRFYIKTAVHSTEQQKRADVPISKKESMITYDWKYQGIAADTFVIASLLKEESQKLQNYSFVHSILSTIDHLYYSSSTQQKYNDCKDFVEYIRTKIYKSKLTKEESEIVKNLENNTFTDSTIQSIVNLLDSFHLLILSNESPKLFVNSKTKKNVPDYTSSSNLVILYYDNVKENYSPLEYNLENRDNFYINWREKEFLQMIKKVFLYNKPAETKNWAVADLRDWIHFFRLPINPKLSKKEIIEKIGVMGIE